MTSKRRLRARKITVRREDARQLNSYTPERVRIRFRDAEQWGGQSKFPEIAAEGFALHHQKYDGHVDLFIIARDAGGAMYGGLELAEQIRAHGIEGVVDTARNPYMPMRGTKFNIPLDLRNPSYSDMSDSAQENIATVWDFEFWRAYLDHARARPLQLRVAVEPASLPVDGEGARVPGRGAQRCVALEDQIRRGLSDAHRPVL